MASFFPLVAILNQNKFTGSNYVDWKRNLDIVLIAKEHKYVLSQSCPNFPSLGAPLEEKQRYDRWQKFNEMAKCYILASISNVVQHQMQDVELASNIMLSLKEMFGEQGRSARQETMRQIYNTKMAKSTSVREHGHRMISHLNTLEVLGVDIDGESQVDLRKNSLGSRMMDSLRSMVMLTEEYVDGLTEEYGDGLAKEYVDGLMEEYVDGLTEVYSDGLTNVYSDRLAEE
ncbi:uncharacterized protein LOC136067848 [Quercus suber]|uniref:uncharacterized protein LOC136067848 n=1 Tax=Quercus suber TaxID=58331 RepID=UPI0032DED202